MLTLTPSSTGTFPYVATAYALEGAVPAGQSVVSPEDPGLAAAVLSRWPDGSASVVVLSGQLGVSAGSSRQVSLRAGTDTRPALTAARVAQLVTSVAVNAGAAGSATLTSFGSPERLWWASSAVVCCRYRTALASGLEAVIDIHAFASDRAWVEVVIENGRVAVASPTTPTAKTYSATVAVNGQTVATATTPAQGHEGFRAWYCSTWVGGDPGIEVTQDAAAMQAHPLLFRVDRASNQDLAGLYGADSYAPWSTGRHRATNMGAGGDHSSIGALTQWDTRYLQSGSRHARRAVIANALAVLSYNVNYRDAASGRVPGLAETGTRFRNAGTWPQVTAEPSWEIAHHPATGLLAFLCRPSPCFIELAQKVALWNGTYAVGDWSFGVYAQTRGRAWSIRSQAHALFLTPDSHEWKASGRSALANAVASVDAYRTAANNPLQIAWMGSPTWRMDTRAGEGGWQYSLWEHMWLGVELHKAAAAKLLAGAAQAAIDTAATWALSMPVRQVNESAAGEWRYQRYFTTAGRQNFDASNGEYWGSGIYGGVNQDSLVNWRDMFAWYMQEAPPALRGPWKVASDNPTSYSHAAYVTDTVANTNLNYVTHFWAALCMAVERQVPGADTAWNTVISNVTGLDTWRQGFAADPRQGNYPRNKP